jgi:hypothetical protein
VAAVINDKREDMVPAVFEFEMPTSVRSFTVTASGKSFTLMLEIPEEEHE